VRGGEISGGIDDLVPAPVVRGFDKAFRVLEALEDARLALRERQDELATVVRILHDRLCLDEGGVPRPTAKSCCPLKRLVGSACRPVW
jgi:hypothetical protein